MAVVGLLSRKINKLSMLVLVGCFSVFAEDRTASRSQFVIPNIDRTPHLDGKVNESVWQNALRIDTFYQFTPNNGEPPSQKTHAYMYCDANNLYVAFRCFDTEPDKIRATLAPRRAQRHQAINPEFGPLLHQRVHLLALEDALIDHKLPGILLGQVGGGDDTGHDLFAQGGDHRPEYPTAAIEQFDLAR